jgi:hypothetical protein
LKGRGREGGVIAINAWEKNRQELVDFLELGGTRTTVPLLALLKSSAPDRPLREIQKESGVSTIIMMEAVQRARRVKAEQEAHVEFAESLPAVARDLRRNALDVGVWCDKCDGTGETARVERLIRKPGQSTHIMLKCRTCRGTGTRWMPTKHKKWATGLILKATKIIEPGGGVAVNVSQQQALVAQPGVFARLLEAADEVLYPKAAPPKELPVEAEVVKPAPPPGAFSEMLDDVVKPGGALAAK